MPTTQSPVRSPLKGILRTPIKALADCFSSSGVYLLSSPVSRTPKKSVTWSPSPQKCRVTDSSITFKVPESPQTPSRTAQRLTSLVSICSPVRSTNPKRDIFKNPDKTCEESQVTVSEKARCSSEEHYHGLKTPEKRDSVSLQEMPPLQVTPPLERQDSRKPKTHGPHHMISRSGRTSRKSSNDESPLRPVLTPGGDAAPSEASDISVKCPAKSLTRRGSGEGVRTTRHKLRSQSSESVSSYIAPGSSENCEQSNSKEVLVEPVQTSEADLNSHIDLQQFDSTHFHSASTNDDSMDIVNAAITKTQFTGGLKMNISFSRKPSQSSEDFTSTMVSPKPCQPPHGTPGRSYGFRQTPDRQQREAAARLGYANESPRFSTPRGPAGPCQQKQTGTLNLLTYQVEMEMQMSGLPKLKIKRTDSMNADDVAAGSQSPTVGVKPPQLESPMALLSKHRDTGCVSPSLCTHVTPAKSTPGKGVQTFICQSYTPTGHSAGTWSPVAVAETIPLTPSPQSVGKTAPDSLKGWPRRKRAQTGVGGGKDHSPKVETLDEAELGVSRLQDVEDADEPLNNKTASIPSVRAAASPLSPLKDFYWMEKLAQQANCEDPQTTEEEMMRTSGKSLY